MKIETWFPVSILSGFLDISPECRKTCLDKIFSIQKLHGAKNNNWRCDTFSTINLFDMKSDSDFIPIFQELNPVIYTFAKYLGVFSPNINCVGSWANIAPTGEYQEFHNHPNSHLSAVLYLQTFENCGNIVFKSHESLNNMFEFKTYDEPSSFQSCSYVPEDLKILCFKSNLWHMVEKNKSQQNRISLAFNFTVI